jgi:predicted transcriptional regulator
LNSTAKNNKSLQDEKIPKKLDTLTQEVTTIGYDVLGCMAQDPTGSSEFQAHLEQRLEHVESQLSELADAQKALAAQPDLLADEVAETFGQTCQDIAKYFNDPADGAELADNAQQQVQELLQQLDQLNIGQDDRTALQQKANAFATALAELLDNLNHQKDVLKKVY